MPKRIFPSTEAAHEFIGTAVDRPTDEVELSFSDGLTFRSEPHVLEGGAFTNSYHVSLPTRQVQAEATIHSVLTSVHSFAVRNPEARVHASGGFFFLADKASALPRSIALNLAISKGQIHSLPVVDREALIIKEGSFESHYLRALGGLSIDESLVDWSGSLTPYDTVCKVYGNGNARIEYGDIDGKTFRSLDESSRFTPAIGKHEKVTDLGLMATGTNQFRVVNSSESGNTDIFAHDLVLRTHRPYGDIGSLVIVQSIDTLALSGTLETALSTGPPLGLDDYAAQPINQDRSLGSRPPFSERRMARMVIYEDASEVVHVRLFDGRPGSDIFSGVTPTEASRLVAQENDIRWGLFLDPGQTAKLAVRWPQKTVSYGNRHYLRWPQQVADGYKHQPNVARPVASTIAIR